MNEYEKRKQKAKEEAERKKFPHAFDPGDDTPLWFPPVFDATNPDPSSADTSSGDCGSSSGDCGGSDGGGGGGD